MNKKPEQIKAFLDDLARISLRHKMMIGSNYTGAAVYDLSGLFDGYSATPTSEKDGYRIISSHNCAEITSIDIKELSQ